MTQNTRFAALASALLLAASQASAVTLNFDNLVVGSVLSNQYAALGAVFSANAFSGAGTSSSGEAWATNTDMTIVASSGGDVGGLGLPGLVSGNVLRSMGNWLNENGDASFRVSFSSLATGFSATFAGVSVGSDVSLFAYNGSTLVGTVSGAGSSTGTDQFVLSYAGPVTSVAIRPGSYSDWVAVDNITYTLAPVPEVSTLAMMGLGVLLVALKRRQKV